MIGVPSFLLRRTSAVNVLCVSRERYRLSAPTAHSFFVR